MKLCGALDTVLKRKGKTVNNKKFFWQIFPTALLLIVVSIAAVGWYGTKIIQSFYYQEMQQGIEDRAILLRPNINRLLSSNPRNLQEFCRQIGRAAATRITVVDGNGTVLADSNEDPDQMDNHGSRPEIQKAFTGKMGASLRFSKTLSQNMLYIAIPLTTDTPGEGILRLSVSVAALDTVLYSTRKKLLFGMVCIALIAAVLSYLSARHISKPLEEMRRGAERLASGDTEHPIIIQAAHVPKEMKALSHSLNNMAAQLNSRIKVISQQRNELEAVFSSMTDAVLAISPDHTIIRINRAAAALFHMDEDTVTGMAFEGVIRSRILQEFLIKSLQSNVSLSSDLSLLENGRQMTLHSHAHPLYDGKSNRIGSLVVLTNLTRINQLEHVRQDFVANVSHELKTPITVIRGYVETLLDGALEDSEEAVNFLKTIHRQSSKLDNIVDDLLTLAKIEDSEDKNMVELRKEYIYPILQTAVQTCSVGAEQKKITIQVECDSQLEANVNTSMLEQAMINLLTNAVTYSPDNSIIQVTAQKETDHTKRQFIHIRVKDHGSGIETVHQKRVFERFYRCDKARSRRDGGTGLGLAIVKHIADCHNGTVELNSRMGVGSTFSLILPVGNV